MNFHTNTARAVRARFDYDAAYDAAAEKITEALLAGKHVNCGASTATIKDCAEVIACRRDFDANMSALLTGAITAEQYKQWALSALDNYAKTMAVDLANNWLSCEIDNAEYMDGGR